MLKTTLCACKLRYASARANKVSKRDITTFSQPQAFPSCNERTICTPQAHRRNGILAPNGLTRESGLLRCSSSILGPRKSYNVLFLPEGLLSIASLIISSVLPTRRGTVPFLRTRCCSLGWLLPAMEETHESIKLLNNCPICVFRVQCHRPRSIPQCW